MLWILQISCIILNLLLAYILHNSEYVGCCGNSHPKPFKMQLFKWIIWGIATLIPFVSIASFIVVGIYMLCDWIDDYRIKVDNNSIFLKEY